MATRIRRSFAERDQARVGLVGVVLTLLVVGCALGYSAIDAALSNSSYTAELAESGGLQVGDDVRVAGVPVGEVEGVELEDDHVRVEFAAGDVTLGDSTSAAVKSDNALGRKYLAVTPSGSGEHFHIPLDRTDAGYSVTSALGDLTTTTSELNLDQMSRSFESMATVLNRTPEEFRGALNGVSRLSRVISSRDAELAQLLESANGVSGVLAARNEEITAIFGDGSLLLQELALRQQVIRDILTNVVQVTDQLHGLVQEHANTLGPELAQIQRFARLLGKYRSTLDYALTNLGSFISGLGEAVGSGPFFQAYLQNMTSPTTLTPILSDIMDGN